MKGFILTSTIAFLSGNWIVIPNDRTGLGSKIQDGIYIFKQYDGDLLEFVNKSDELIGLKESEIKKLKREKLLIELSDTQIHLLKILG